MRVLPSCALHSPSYREQLAAASSFGLSIGTSTREHGRGDNVNKQGRYPLYQRDLWTGRSQSSCLWLTTHRRPVAATLTLSDKYSARSVQQAAHQRRRRRRRLHHITDPLPQPTLVRLSQPLHTQKHIPPSQSSPWPSPTTASG